MKKVAILFLIAAAFVGATGTGAGMPNRLRPATERKPLYWVDPMHPWYKSDKPGIAPDCGMKLVPVYTAPEEKPGTLQIPPEKQQLMGVCTRRRRI